MAFKFDLKEVYSDFKEMITQSVNAHFEEGGETPPVIFIGFASKTQIGSIEAAVLPAHSFMSSSFGKQMLAKVLRGIVKDKKPIFIAMVTEAWMAKAESKEQIQQMLPLSESSNKKEVVLITFEGENFARQITGEIIREEGKPPMVAHFEEMVSETDAKNAKVTGTFAEFFSDKDDEDEDDNIEVKHIKMDVDENDDFEFNTSNN